MTIQSIKTDCLTLPMSRQRKKMTAHIRQRICVRTHTFQEWREGLMMV